MFAADEKKMYVSGAPTSSKWFPRFMLGAKRRMGVIRKQDEALTIPQLLGFLDVAEEDWQKSSSPEERRAIEEVAAFTIIAFCIALRGEEVPMVVVEGLVDFWHETRRHRIPHIRITLRGQFNGKNNLRWY